MITTTPVARWTWGRDHHDTDTVDLCLRELLSAYAVLATHHLVVDSAVVHVEVPEAGKPKNILFEGDFAVNGSEISAEYASQLADQIQAGRQTGPVGSVDTLIECTGILSEDANEIIQPKLFRLATHAYRDYITTSLVTFSDAWMPYDLKGRAQPAIYSAHQPRLAAALRNLSDVLDSETDPDDSTYFGTPTETGVDNYFEPDGSPSDVWARYEV
ncbi:hypothetical protein VMT65_08155 [Nocardia sp. CDC153]|uniref:hypothetical protein n=1 Tax=Nocardia sp. CDC153 TaxID=3112167 RepID=UPI002DBDF2EA|nr:hypothetical protein [Nocardia sp. CDC153]MEC3952998.1 hypothetical protein [Nocardia sp. CDC153]